MMMAQFQDTSQNPPRIFEVDQSIKFQTDANGFYRFYRDGVDLNWPITFVPYVAPVVTPPPVPLAELQASQIAIINMACQESLLQLVSSYPEMEISTWPQQYREAQAFQLSTTAQTPMLDAIASASGSTVAALATTVLNKATSYQSASGELIGKRQALTAKIEAIADSTPANPSAATIAAIAAIVWQ